jgi:hypothetical protein
MIPWSSISIQLEGFSGRTPRFVGIALVDRRFVGDLVSDTPRSFRVEPGVHTVTVYFSKRIRSSPSGRRVGTSIQVEVQPGESARFVCGASEEWKRLRPMIRRDCGVILAGMSLAAAGGWLGFPFLRESIAGAALYLDMNEPWMSLLYFIVGSRWMTTLLVSDAYCLIAVLVLLARLRRHLRRLGLRSVEPYQLARVIDGPDKSKGD